MIDKVHRHSKSLISVEPEAPDAKVVGEIVDSDLFRHLAELTGVDRARKVVKGLTDLSEGKALAGSDRRRNGDGSEI